MDNVQNCDSCIIIPSAQTYWSCLQLRLEGYISSIYTVLISLQFCEDVWEHGVEDDVWSEEE
jgi:hypothetical protein